MCKNKHKLEKDPEQEASGGEWALYVYMFVNVNKIMCSLHF